MWTVTSTLVIISGSHALTRLSGLLAPHLATRVSSSERVQVDLAAARIVRLHSFEFREQARGSIKLQREQRCGWLRCAASSLRCACFGFFFRNALFCLTILVVLEEACRSLGGPTFGPARGAFTGLGSFIAYAERLGGFIPSGFYRNTQNLRGRLRGGAKRVVEHKERRAGDGAWAGGGGRCKRTKKKQRRRIRLSNGRNKRRLLELPLY